MNARIVELDASVHQKVQKLLPWVVTGRLGNAEQEMADTHLAGCAQCRDDLAWQRKLQAVQPAAGAAPDMEAALARLLPQLEVPARPAANDNRWWPWAIAAQLLVIAGLGGALLTHQAEPTYRLLGTPGAGAGNLVVVFHPDTSEGRVRALLQAQGARVVDGPTVTRAWVLQVAPARLAGAVGTLRADAAVELAEPLAAPQ
jgi:hypothetical protein